MPDPGLAKVPPQAPGEGEYATMVQHAGQGMADQWKVDMSEKMLRSGVSQSDVDGYWGDQEKDPAAHPVAQQVQQNQAVNEKRGGLFGIGYADYDDSKTVAQGLWQSVQAGWDNSAAGVTLNKGNQHYVTGPKTGYGGAVAAAITQTVGDLPYAFVGAAGGAAAGGAATENPLGLIIGGRVGGGALPQAVRESVLDAHNYNPNESPVDLAKTVLSSAWNITKAGTISALAPGVGGKVESSLVNAGAHTAVATGANIATQAAVAATASAGLEGRLPTATDFSVNAATMLGLHVVTHSTMELRVVKNMQRNFAETGMTPQQQVKLAEDSPTMKQELMAQDVNGNPNLAEHHLVAAPEGKPFMEPTPGRGPTTTASGKPATSPTGEMGMTSRQVIPFVETGGLKNPSQAVSPVGAIGEHQIMPATARQYMGANFDPHTLFDPKVNAQVYGHIMDDLEKRFPGNPEAQAVAYNAGPGRASEFLREGPGTRLVAIPDKTAHGGMRFEDEPAARNESSLPMETQKYLAKARYYGMNSATGAVPDPNELPRSIMPEETPSETDETEQELSDQELKVKSAEQDLSAANAWKGASEEDLLAEMGRQIGTAPSPKSFDVDKMVTSVFNELHPAAVIDGKLMSEGLLDTNKELDLQDIYRKTYSSQTRAYLGMTEGAVDPQSYAVDRNAPTAVKAMQQLKADGGTYDGMNQYRLALATVGRFAEGKDTGASLGAAQELVNNATAKKHYAQATQIFQDFKDTGIDYATKKGYFTPEQANRLKAISGYQMSFNRIMGTASNAFKKTGGFGVGRVYNFEGGDAQITDPFRADLDNYSRIIANADRNEARLSTVALAKRNPLIAATMGLAAVDRPVAYDDQIEAQLRQYGIPEADFDNVRQALEPLIQERIEQGLDQHEFAVRENGKLQVYRVQDPDFAKMIKGVTSTQEGSMVVDAFAAAAGMLRNSVEAAPDFMARITGWHDANKFMFSPEHPLPIVHTVGGLIKSFQAPDEFNQFLARGGSSSVYDANTNHFQSQIEGLFDKTGVWDKTWNTFMKPLDALQAIHARLTQASAYGYYNLLQSKGYASDKAAMLSRTESLDYSQKASEPLVAMTTRMIPFTRGRLLGDAQSFTAMKTNPTGTLARMIGGVTMITMGAYFLNRMQDKELEKEGRYSEMYSELDPSIRQNYIVLPSIMGQRIKLKPPANTGFFFNNIPIRLMQAFDEHDPHAMDKWSADFMHEYMPNLMPPAIQATAENIANYNFSTGRPLMSDDMMKKSGPLRYTQNTSMVARKLAPYLGDITEPVLGDQVSPIQIEHEVNGWAGSVGVGALHVLDAPLGKKPALDNGKLDLASNPFIGSFFARNPGRDPATIENFYTDLNSFETSHADLKAMLEQVKTGDADLSTVMTQVTNPEAVVKMQALTSVSKAISNLNRAIDVTNENKEMTIDEKRQFTDKMLNLSILAAKQGDEVMQQLKGLKLNGS